MSNKHHFKNSSSIASCDYDDANGCLHITFNSGHTHRYKDCPKEIYQGLKAAESPGKFFHAHVRNNYANEKL